MALRIAAASLAALAVLAHTSRADAQQTYDSQTAVAPVDGSTAGGYQGVVPGSGHSPPRAALVMSSRHNYVTWPGFEIGSAGSRIFVQSVRPIAYRRADEPTRIVLVLPRTRVHLWNNHNPLVAEHFNTPVSRAYLRRRGRDTLLVIEMKVMTEPSVTQYSDGGFNFIFLEFPPGNYPVPATTIPAQAVTAADQGAPTSDITYAQPAEGYGVQP